MKKISRMTLSALLSISVAAGGYTPILANSIQTNNSIKVAAINNKKTKSTNTALTSGSATVTIGNQSITLNAAYIVDGIDATISSGTYESLASDQCVFLVVNGGSLKISDSTVKKSGDASNAGSDDYNFYGLNSAIVVVGSTSSATINNVKITATSEGSNAVFATDNAKITINKVNIKTTSNSARGLDATYGGSISAKNITINTAGQHSAALATDRGGGTVKVKGSKNVLNTTGADSPCIYSTGSISVTNATGTAKASEVAVIEGKNTISIKDSKLTTDSGSSNGNYGMMVYQSMSGDAADSDSANNVATLDIKDSEIINKGSGALLYVTNTTANVNVSHSTLTNKTSTNLISAATGRWGDNGSNGGNLNFSSIGSKLKGSISADDISSINVSLTKKSKYIGATSGNVVITADSTSKNN